MVKVCSVKESIEKLFLNADKKDKTIGMFFLYYETNFDVTDPILYLLDQASSMHSTNNIPVITDADVKLLKEGKQYLRGIKPYEAFFEFLLMCNTKIESEFIKSFTSIIDLYFLKNNPTLNDTNNVIFLLDFSIAYGKNFAEQFVRNIFKYLLRKDTNVKYVCLLNNIIKKYGMNDIKRFLNINKVFDKALVSNNVTFADFNQYIELAEFCIIYNKNSKDSKIKYIDIILNTFNDLNDQWFQGKLQKCRDYIKDTNYHMDRLLDIENRIEMMGEKAIGMMKEIRIPFPPEITKQIEEFCKSREVLLNKKTNISKLIWYFFEFYPFKKTDLVSFENDVEKESVFKGMFNTIYYNTHGEVINYVDLTDEEKDTLKCKNGFLVQSQILDLTVCRPFYNSFKMDDDVKQFIIGFSKNNKMIDAKNGWDKKFVDYLFDILGSKIDDMIQKVLPLFENSLRFYFKNEGLYIKKTKSDDYINLGDIFTSLSGVNQYRDKLLEIIDEDYYWMMCYLLTDRLGFNGRNVNLHGADDPNYSRSFPAYYTCVLIFRMFIPFYLK